VVAVRISLVAVLLASATVGLQLVAVQPAAAVPGLERVVGTSPLSGHQPFKEATVQCPFDRHVIGGGAVINDGNRKLVRLTGLEPLAFNSPVSHQDMFIAYAEAPNLNSPYNWTLTVYAMCAYRDLLDAGNYTIVSNFTFGSQTFQTAAARCPKGTVAYGASATISTQAHVGGGLRVGQADGQVGLQLNRTSGPLDISRATGRESPTGYNKPWELRSYAICSATHGGIHAQATISQGASASDTCHNPVIPSFVHGPGGGGGLSDGGPVWLREIRPRPDMTGEDVALTGPPIGGMVAYETCAANTQ
jgi:hypothetical protein